MPLHEGLMLAHMSVLPVPPTILITSSCSWLLTAKAGRAEEATSRESEGLGHLPSKAQEGGCIWGKAGRGEAACHV